MENLIFWMVERGYGWDLVRNIFATLDSVAFFLFSKVMQVMFDIINITSKADLSGFLQPLQSRVYVILSIYMLFKVTVSLLSYIVNPDSMTDKNQGVGKLVQRIIVALVMLIFFPFAFDFLNDLQADIISNNTIPKLVLGVGGGYDNPEGIGTEIAYSVYNGTFMYVEGCDPGNSSSCQIASGEHTVTALTEMVNEPGANRSEYKYGYIPLAGFAVGIVLTILTLSMCIDVAIRVFKLIILQLVAPIPILSYIDPKSSKDGAFSSWMKMIVSVWAEVFVRLFVIYFILLVIVKMINDGGLLFDGTNIFVKIALVIGLLFFAKDAPKFMANAIGIKNLPERGLFSGMGNILAAGALAAGIPMAAAGDFSNRLKTEGVGSAFRNVGRSLFTGLGAGLAGGKAAVGGKGMAGVNDARNKYVNDRLSYVSSSTKKDQYAHDRLKNVFDKASNLKKIMDDEAAKDDDYKLFAANVNAARNGDSNALEWLAGRSDASHYMKSVTKTVGTGTYGPDGKERTRQITENVVDVGAASVYQEDLLHSIGDTLLSSGSNGAINDAYSAYTDAAGDANGVRVDGSKISVPDVTSRSDIGKVQGATGHLMGRIEQKSTYKGASRRKK